MLEAVGGLGTKVAATVAAEASGTFGRGPVSLLVEMVAEADMALWFPLRRRAMYSCFSFPLSQGVPFW